jgi:ADP-ribose pyrophosphatase YjhB (NUDIX family)
LTVTQPRATSFADSYLGQLRAVVGDRMLLVPGARIVIEDNAGHILLQHRSDFEVWGLPGGNAEIGEPLEAMIVREVLEETGLTIANPAPFGFANDPRYETFTFPNGHQCQFFGMLFATRTYSGELHVADDESLALNWFKRDALPEMLPNMLRTIEAHDRYRTTGTFQLI